jgi:hypothetical protein
MRRTIRGRSEWISRHTQGHMKEFDCERDSSEAFGLAHDVLIATHAAQHPDFVGLGLVLYVPPIDFPTVPLGGWLLPRPNLPVSGIQAISELLVQLSVQSSAWHDGFHFIDYKTRTLTHISQFLAPDLASINSNEPAELPTGARQLAAMLISRYPSVGCVGLLTKDDQIGIFVGGRMQLRTPVNRA